MIENNTLENFTCEIYNSKGNLIHVSKNKNSIDVSNFPAGVYIVKIIDVAAKKFHTEKIIIK